MLAGKLDFLQFVYISNPYFPLQYYTVTISQFHTFYHPKINNPIPFAPASSGPVSSQCR